MTKKMATKTRYKMYKKGKSWVIAGIISVAVAMSMGVTAQAAVTSVPAEASSPVTVVVPPAGNANEATTASETAKNDSANISATTTTPGEGSTVTADMQDAGASAAEEITSDATTIDTATDGTGTTTTDTTGISGGDTTETNATSTTDTGAGENGTATTDTADANTTETNTGEANNTETNTATTDTATDPTTDTGTTTDQSVTPTPSVPVPTPTDVTPIDVSALPDTSEMVTVPETRPADVADLPALTTPISELGADLSTAAVPLVQTELGKTTTMALTLTKETATIDLWMPNQRLQQVVLMALQKLTNTDKTWETVADITQDDMALLTTLLALGNEGIDTYIDGKTAFSLEGLEYAVNLETIMMGASLNYQPGAFYGDIEDVTPLANLQHLKVVDLQNNRIKDVTPLANLQNVVDMRLAYNAIRDFSPLKDKAYASASDFTHTGQFIMLDPVKISDKDREGHLQIACTTITGEVVQLTVVAMIGQPIFYTDANGHTYQAYFTGGNATPDGEGGLYYTNIQDQKPGATEIEKNPGINLDVLPDYYYLTGVHKPSAGIMDFAVVQPYAIAQSAASVTVHYQDVAGNQLAPDATLKPGLIGETYTTEALQIPGHVLQQEPENATGTYGDAEIHVTYVYSLDEGDPGVTQPPVTNPGGGNNGNGNNNGNNGNGGGETPGVTNPGDNGNGDGNNGTGNLDGNGTDEGESEVEGNESGDDNHLSGGNTGGAGDTGNTGTGTTPGTSTPGNNPGGQVVQMATGGQGATGQVSTGTGTTTVLRDDADQDQQPAVTHAGFANLPQTGEREPVSLAWGVALLVGLLSLTNFKRKTKDKE